MKNNRLIESLFDLLQGKSSKNSVLKEIVGEDKLNELQRKVTSEKDTKPPKVAVIGKAGVGKSTTINNLFNAQNVTSHVLVGTKNVHRKVFDLEGGGKLDILDFPGLGVDLEEDIIYEEMYIRELPEADVILYVIQANERILREDQRIIEDVVLRSLHNVIKGDKSNLQKKIVIGLNKVDEIGPGTWDRSINQPNDEQGESIEKRCDDIVEKLTSVLPISKKQIVYYSAEQRFRLLDLLNAIIQCSGSSGWKLATNPKPWWELAEDPRVAEIVRKNSNR